jgi:hypothetical protein
MPDKVTPVPGLNITTSYSPSSTGLAKWKVGFIVAMVLLFVVIVALVIVCCKLCSVPKAKLGP